MSTYLCISSDESFTSNYNPVFSSGSGSVVEVVCLSSDDEAGPYKKGGKKTTTPHTTTTAGKGATSNATRSKGLLNGTCKDKVEVLKVVGDNGKLHSPFPNKRSCDCFHSGSSKRFGNRKCSSASEPLIASSQSSSSPVKYHR